MVDIAVEGVKKKFDDWFPKKLELLTINADAMELTGEKRLEYFMSVAYQEGAEAVITWFNSALFEGGD
jgi:hypothetical protein